MARENQQATGQILDDLSSFPSQEIDIQRSGNLFGRVAAYRHPSPPMLPGMNWQPFKDGLSPLRNIPVISANYFFPESPGPLQPRLLEGTIPPPTVLTGM